MRELILIVLLLGSLSFGQEFKQLKVSDGTKSMVIKNALLNYDTNTLSYTNSNGEMVVENLDQFSKIQYKKGSHWLAGMLGGMVGGFLGNAITRDSDDEIWYGAGPPILFGGLLGAAIGSFTPKYKVLEKNDTSVSFGFNSVQIRF